MSFEFTATAALRASLLMALGLAALRWLPNERPQWRRCISIFCLAASLVLPFLPVVPAPGSVVVMASPVWSGANVVAAAQISGLAWLVGGALAALQLIRRGTALCRWIARCEPLLLPAGISSTVPVRVCRGAVAPCVAGFLRPVLIVPRQASGWDAETWRCVLAHELQHVRQGDLWLGWITHAVRVLHWWNPLAWQLSRRVGFESEACCDDAVLRAGVGAADYARVLLQFTTAEATHPVGFFIHGRTPSSLRLRMERLFGSAPSRVSAWRIVSVISLLAAGMGGCVWLGFAKPQLLSEKPGLAHEAELRWQANPFPADEH